MNYELAKKLKDAGWPQSSDDKKVVLIREMIDIYGHTYPAYVHNANIHESACIRPTLSELIDVCGKEFRSIKRDRMGFWHAEASKFMGFDTFATYYHCKTPQEAVAHLWLELNKK